MTAELIEIVQYYATFSSPKSSLASCHTLRYAPGFNSGAIRSRHSGKSRGELQIEMEAFVEQVVTERDDISRGRRLLSGISKPNTKPNAVRLGPAKSLEAAKAFVRGTLNGIQVLYVQRAQKIFFRDRVP